MSDSKRIYHQTARAASTESLRQKIIMSFNDLLLVRWIDEITLDEVAAAAGTTRQTVIRLFGGKEGVLSAAIDLLHARSAPRIAMPHNVSGRAAIKALVERGIPVFGHLGFTPQSVNLLGARVQGRDDAGALALRESAHALEAAGASAICGP